MYCGSIFLLFFVLIVVLFTSSSRVLPLYKCNGTHFQCFSDLAKQFKDEILLSWEHSNPSNLLKWYANNLEAYEQFVYKVKTQYPRYYDEIEGYADGSGLAFNEVFLMNIQEEIGRGCRTKSDISGYPYSSDFVKQCSDIHLNNALHHAIGHNEDTGDIMRNISFLVDLELHDLSSGSRQHIFAYVYPGWLPGIAFGFNNHGFTFSMNGVYPKTCLNDIPKSIINRDILTSESVEDAFYKASIKGYPRSFGLSINIGSIWDKRQFLLEVSPRRFGVFEIDEMTGNYSHFNNYRLLNIEYTVDGSSIKRLEKMNELPVILTKEDVVSRLGTPPIYNSMTVASALFDLDGKMIFIYDDNPENSQPVNSYSLVLS